MVHGGMTLVKYLLFLFNFIFWLTGVGILVIGVVVQINYHQSLNLLGDDFMAAPYLFISIGSLIAILGFFGCCGAIRENYCMTMTFGVLLTVIFLLELAACIAVYVTHKQVEQAVTSKLMEGIDKYEPPNNEGEYVKEVEYISRGWDIMQAKFKCCGVNEVGYHDWGNVTFYAEHDLDRNSEQHLSVPDSCCVLAVDQLEASKGCGNGMRMPVKNNKKQDQLPTTIYTNGCVATVKEYVRTHQALFGGLAAGITVVQFFMMCFACCLSKSILKDFEEFYY